MDAQITAMMKQHGSLVTASLAAAEQMVFKARMERSAIEFDLRAAYARIESLQARTAGLKEQHAKAIDAVNVALERQEALRTVLQPIAPWMFAVPAGDGPRAVEWIEPVVGMEPAPARPIGVGQFLRAKA